LIRYDAARTSLRAPGKFETVEHDLMSGYVTFSCYSHCYCSLGGAPSVTSRRTAYLTCWIGFGRCVRASLNSGLTSMYCDPTAAPKPQPRPALALRARASRETSGRVIFLARRRTDAHAASSAHAHPQQADGRPSETPSDPKPTPDAQSKADAVAGKVAEAHESVVSRVVSVARGSLGAMRSVRMRWSAADQSSFAVRHAAAGELQVKLRVSGMAVRQHQGRVHLLSWMSEPPTTITTSNNTTTATPSCANSALLHGDSTPSSARLISSSGLDAFRRGGRVGGRRALPPVPPPPLPLVSVRCCFWKSVHAPSQSMLSLSPSPRGPEAMATRRERALFRVERERASSPRGDRPLVHGAVVVTRVNCEVDMGIMIKASDKGKKGNLFDRGSFRPSAARSRRSSPAARSSARRPARVRTH